MGNREFSADYSRLLPSLSMTSRLMGLPSAADVPDMGYHELRHGAVSLIAAHAVPARTAMEIVGNAQISTTMNIYAHVASDVQREAADHIAKSRWGWAGAGCC